MGGILILMKQSAETIELTCNIQSHDCKSDFDQIQMHAQIAISALGKTTPDWSAIGYQLEAVGSLFAQHLEGTHSDCKFVNQCSLATDEYARDATAFTVALEKHDVDEVKKFVVNMIHDMTNVPDQCFWYYDACKKSFEAEGNLFKELQAAAEKSDWTQIGKDAE